MSKMAATVNIRISLLVLMSLLLTSSDALRQIQSFFTPGCLTNCEGGVAYIRAKGDSNTLHYVITPIGPPTVIVIMTKNSGKAYDTGITIDWDRLKSDNITEREGSITLDKDLKVMYTYGIVFTRLFQYNDTSDDADLTSSSWRVFDFSRSMFTWEDLKVSSSDYSILLKVTDSAEIEGQSINNGSLQFKFNIFDHMDRATELPHLQYSEDMIQFDFQLMDIDTGNMSLARFALEAVLFSTDSMTGNMKFDETKSIDDEYTPGVFKISNWVTRAENQENTGFLQHKPVCYTKPARGRAYATFARGYNLASDTKGSNIPVPGEVKSLLNQSAVLSYFGIDKMADLRMSATNFSFGLGEDGTFTKTNYTVWTASLGYGKPPNDAVSTLVVGVISAGLGIPVILILFGGLFICIKRKTNPDIVDASKQGLIN